MESPAAMSEYESSSVGAVLQSVPPEYGLKVKLNHSYPEMKKPSLNRKWHQIAPLIPLGVRYVGYHCKCKMRKVKPIMDFINLQTTRGIYGCPLGGIGGGTIGRGFKGEFCRYQLRPGIYEYVTYPENQFIINIRDENNKTIYQSVLSTYTKPKKAPKSWQWNLDGSKCEYTGLYPRAWTTYDLSEYGIMLVGRQISPVIPNNYKDSSLPCAVFVWDIKNVCRSKRTVSITFTFRDTNKKNKKNVSESNNFERYCDSHTCGVSLETYIDDMMCTFTIAKRKQTKDSTTDGFCKFNTKKAASHVWNCLLKEGRLIPGEIPTVTNYSANAIGLSSQATVEPEQVTSLEFCLVWDMPIIHFLSSTRKHHRYYTRFFGSEGMAGPSIATYSLLTYKKWEEDINQWQNPVLEDESLPSWYKGALFNQLYYIVDGGTVWFDVSDHYPRSDPRWSYGVFGYLEGHEYRMYNTYDVHFYASFALAQLWPRLQISLQYDFKDAVSKEIADYRKHLFCGTTDKRKYKDGVPHDLGDPSEDPFHQINAYNIHDVSEWRDLNLKFILQVFRDFTLLRTEQLKQRQRDKYQSLEFIDDLSDDEEDLYFRSTNQTKEEYSQAMVIEQILNHRMKVKQMNGGIGNNKHAEEDLLSNKIPRENHVSVCSNEFSDGDSKLKHPVEDCKQVSDDVKSNKDEDGRINRFAPREKHISICSADYADVDSGFRAPHVMRQNSGVKSSYQLAMEEALQEDAVDAERFIQDMYSTCRMLVDKILTWDKDDDGLIENTGHPDQTFDVWVMKGPSAYCGGLWLAVLYCMHTMASILNNQDDINFFSKLLNTAKSSFDTKLWNGLYYNFDEQSKVIMADQLCGQWYLRACGFQHPVFPKDKVASVLKTIFENNVMKFAGGEMGAVNGFMPGTPGHKDLSSFQSEEVWTGVTYGLSALMLHEGMMDEGFKTAGGMYQSLSHRFGMSFDTPEALYEDGSYRSIGYMRPLSIWAMHLALNVKPLKY